MALTLLIIANFAVQPVARPNATTEDSNAGCSSLPPPPASPPKANDDSDAVMHDELQQSGKTSREDSPKATIVNHIQAVRSSAGSGVSVWFEFDNEDAAYIPADADIADTNELVDRRRELKLKKSTPPLCAQSPVLFLLHDC